MDNVYLIKQGNYYIALQYISGEPHTVKNWYDAKLWTIDDKEEVMTYMNEYGIKKKWYLHELTPHTRVRMTP